MRNGNGHPRPRASMRDLVGNVGKRSEQLSAEADAAESRLIGDFEALDQRRRDALDVPLQLSRHPAPILVVGSAIVAGIVALAALVFRHVSKAPVRRRKDRVEMLERLWRHPEKFGERRSLLEDLGRSIVVGVVSAAVVVPTRALIKRFYD